jgi:hypothetical protein
MGSEAILIVMAFAPIWVLAYWLGLRSRRTGWTLPWALAGAAAMVLVLLLVRLDDMAGMLTRAAVPVLFVLGWWRNRVPT